jgi:hypothetical protein
MARVRARDLAKLI